ncbi:L-xylulose reductase [Hypsibius exemplaris]|uniref:L-xylulose reductase n=1 Tax=Hypsibius exemplaris TaxID=2072580 RepID=A0A9X6NCH5_HYPEX|nr:L-xylulose reductase [Hypsibius exemplaris]
MADSFFVGKRVLVTGGGRGIGKGIVLRLQELGATVFALTVSDSSFAELQNIPGIHALQVELSDWDATRAAVTSVLPIDLLVNNAGIFIGEPFLRTTQESFDSIMTVNVKSILNISQVVAQSLIDRKCDHGSIVNLSSVASKIALKDHTAYCTSKAALDGLTRSMALELGEHKIRVNSLNPTVILTDMGRQGWSDVAKAGPLLQRIPLHRFGEVDECVNAVVFLLSDQSRFISGAHIPLDGGLLAT